ncbi:DUF1433 domain-containing protein [Bacillus sp. NTK071]|uniref:DUF1433 domain-containing protein n=1 Tax=Bacillus sp. NTK071 TaxID=2802175 RepID=UPI001A8F672A|nr:DUF1433 domain-containing protein [Bacillus sp. NTK071]
MNSNNETYDQEFITKAEKKAESYLRNNYKNIDKIKFSDDHSNPMGGLVIRGTINDNSNFSMDVDDSLKIIAISEGENFPEEKDECKDKTCDY